MVILVFFLDVAIKYKLLYLMKIKVVLLCCMMGEVFIFFFFFIKRDMNLLIIDMLMFFL